MSPMLMPEMRPAFKYTRSPLTIATRPSHCELLGRLERDLSESIEANALVMTDVDEFRILLRACDR